jgi:Polyketide cyclase / dehydrase and lipid transport
MKKPAIAMAVFLGALGVSCLPASALESSKTVTSTESVDQVWKKIGDFCGIGNWHPAVAKCELSSDGKERTLSLKGGGTIVEDLVEWNADKHSYTYRIKSSPLPITGYISTLSVEPNGDGSTIAWSGHYEAKGAPDAKAKDAVDGIYAAGLESLAK